MLVLPAAGSQGLVARGQEMAQTVVLQQSTCSETQKLCHTTPDH